MNLARSIAQWSHSDPGAGGVDPARPDGNAVLADFIARCRAMDRPRVLELGTKRSLPDRSTRHQEWIPNAHQYLGADLEAGADVDIVADVHRLTDVTGEECFDVLISCSTFEHFKYPHVAAHQLLKALRVGGVLFIQTVQSFPLHGFPCDYYRFSREALASLFGTKMGFKVIATDYEFPARICSDADPYLGTAPAFVNVRLWGEKTGPTPEDYIFELDVP
jgi:hypothetical protein